MIRGIFPLIPSKRIRRRSDGEQGTGQTTSTQPHRTQNVSTAPLQSPPLRTPISQTSDLTPPTPCSTYYLHSYPIYLGAYTVPSPGAILSCHPPPPLSPSLELPSAFALRPHLLVLGHLLHQLTSLRYEDGARDQQSFCAFLCVHPLSADRCAIFSDRWSQSATHPVVAGAMA